MCNDDDKRKAAASSTTWRDALFIWDGIVEFVDQVKTTTTTTATGNESKENEDVGVKDKAEEEGNDKETAPGSTDAEAAAAMSLVVRWEGVWVSVEKCADAKLADLPKRGFGRNLASQMTFSVRGEQSMFSATRAKEDGGSSDTATAGPHNDMVHNDDDNNIPYLVDFVEGEGFHVPVLDGVGEDENKKSGDENDGHDGEGKDQPSKQCKDAEHKVLLPYRRWTGNVKDQRENLAFAMGRNQDFGPFIAVGWMRPGNRLTLGRRYLDESDARVQWTWDELKTAVLSEIAHFSNKEQKVVVTLGPWKCSAFHSHLMMLPASKKQRLEEKTEQEE